MILFPAIDILKGQAVRLSKGRYDAATIYQEDPVAQASAFAEGGARWIHVVDLDGAREGRPVNGEVIAAIIAHVGHAYDGVNVEVGGGVRSLEAIGEWVEAGAKRVVVGTRLVSDPSFVEQAVDRYGAYLVAGVDAREGDVAVSGWEEASGVSVESLVQRLKAQGVQNMVYTDIARDGMQTGIDVDAYRNIARRAGFPVVASGGIASLADLTSLAQLGPELLQGAIVGRALYEKAFSLEEALAACETGEGRC